MEAPPLFTTERALATAAAHLARQLATRLLGSDVPETGLALRLDITGLVLVDLATAATLQCDFVTGRQGYRLRHATLQQPLPRAVGLGHGQRPQVLDATAGLGRDGVLLAALGCRVLMVERVPAIHALLHDGLERLRGASPAGAQAVDRITLCLAEARDMLETLPVDERPQVVYLDPMHPPRHSSALVRQEMRLLRAVAGGDGDAGRLLPVARRAARDRVVVKRPASAAPLDDTPPDWSLGGRTTRFDVYRAGGSG